MRWYHVEHSNRKGYADSQLRFYIREFKRQIFYSDNDEFIIEITGIVIGYEIMALLVELLSQPLPHASARHNGGEEAKWSEVNLYHCTASDPRGVETDNRCCTPDELRHLCSVISRRAKSVRLHYSTEILDSWMSSPQCDPIILSCLDIDEVTPLSLFQHARLATMIQNSPQLQTLYLTLRFEEAQLLLDSLANAFHLCDLSLDNSLQSHHSYQFMPTPVLSAVVGLLQNPLSQLQKLWMSSFIVDDCQVTMIAHLLPTSQLRLLHVLHKTTRFQGLLEFAHQLPRIQNLKSVRFGLKDCNRANETEIDYEECGNALIQGLMKNLSLEDTDLISLFQGLQRDLMEHYITLNRSGRRILATSLPVPVGLWPFLLERAMKKTKYQCYIEKQATIQADIVFFFLKSNPTIWGTVNPTEE